jgi:hypothetical protein
MLQAQLMQLLFLQWLGSAEMCRDNLLYMDVAGPVKAVYNKVQITKRLF